jgi:hypothetical protein
MTLNCFPQKLGAIKQHLKINKKYEQFMVFLRIEQLIGVVGHLVF